jgi:hypothetical protein
MAAKAKGKRVRRSVGEQRAVLSRFAGSGLGVGAFCQGEGINPTSLYRWQARHGKPSVGGNEVTPAERAPAFVDVGALRTVSPSGQRLDQTLCDHAAGNYRVLTTMAAELLAVAAQRELAQLDEKLYLDVFAPPESAATRRKAAAR